MTKEQKKKNLTTYEQKKQDKKEFHETAEEILTTGSESVRKGQKATKEIEAKKIKEDAVTLSQQLEISTKSRRRDDFIYLKSVREVAVEGVNLIDYKDYPGWRVWVYITTGAPIQIGKQKHSTERGLLAIVRSPKGEYLHKGMRASFDPMIDVMGARSIPVWIEDTLDYYTGQIEGAKPEKPKIWTPANA